MPDTTPFTALKRFALTTVSPKSALVAVSRAIEARAMSVQGPARLWVCLQHEEFNTGRTRAVHDQLAFRGVRVDVYGQGVRAAGPRPTGIELHDLSGYSPIAREWTVLLVAEGLALGMAARELQHDAGPAATRDRDRRFEWLLTADPDDIRFAASTLPADIFVPGTEFA